MGIVALFIKELYMTTFEGIKMMMLNVLGLPPAASIRSGSGSNSDNTAVIDDDFTNSIVEITADDVCIGNSPLYLKFKADTPTGIQEVGQEVIDEFNSIVKWACVDLLKKGFSVYESKKIEVKVKGKKVSKLVLYPVLGNLKFYLTKEKKVKVFKDEEKTNIKDVIIFINYNKDSLLEIEDKNGIGADKELIFQITPTPVQLNNVSTAATDLLIAEKAIQRYRKDISRVVRFLTVDVGVSQGDKQQEVVDAISSAINANSFSLTPSSQLNDLDDAIPVIPTRRGFGKPELTEQVPNANITDMVDLDYWMQKYLLGLRFPKTYTDFSQNLDQTAVSMIRGDIRYSRLIDKARTLLLDTINDYLSSNDKFENHEVAAELTEYPTPEDEDVIAALESYTDFTSNVYDFIITNSESKDEASIKLQLLERLLGGSSNLPSIQSWFEDLRSAILKMFNESTEPGEAGDGDFEGGADDTSGGDFEFDEGEGADEGGGDYTTDVEVLEPSEPDET